MNKATIDAILTSKILGDGIGIAVGSTHYVTNHRFPDLYISTDGGRTPRLSVSRYYWDLEPPVAVDMLRNIKYGEMEIAFKKQYFKDRDMYYIWVKDDWDGERAEQQLTALRPDPEQRLRDSVGPLVGPRRKK